MFQETVKCLELHTDQLGGNMLLRGAFTALCLISGVSSLLVPPPAHVIVSCQNVKTTVSWDYSEQQLGTSFRVAIISSAGLKPHVDNTTDHQYDLSSFVWQSEEHFLSFLYVMVTAIQGENQSEAVQSNTFSFNDLKTVNTKCFLDFPPVDLNVHEKKTSVKFQNPLSFYKELSSASDITSSEFRFDVISAGHKHNFGGNCSVKDRDCKLDVMFPEGEEKCVTLTGMLSIQNEKYQVPFRETNRSCLTEPPWLTELDYGVHAVIMISSFVFVICVVVILICKVKAWTMKTPNLPKLLEVQTNHMKVHQTVKAVMSPVFFTKPSKTTLITSEDSYPERRYVSSTDSDSSPSDGHFYMERGRQLEDSNQEAEGFISGGVRTDEDSADDSLKTECISVSSQDEERESVSPYDSPHFLVLDMGDGDMVTGYSGKKGDL